jgi:antirestriction protein ArdC
LVAELAACMLCSVAGIDTRDTFNNSASNIAGWLSKLRNDKKLIVQVSNEAQKACDFILHGEIKEKNKSA